MRRKQVVIKVNEATLNKFKKEFKKLNRKESHSSYFERLFDYFFD